jgi:hypothetical protein
MPLLETKGAASAQGFGLTLQQAAANYIEDVFSTWLYTGNGSTQTITTGIDLAGKGGMLWIKNRSSATNNIISDTVRGAGNFLMSNASSQQFFNTDNVSALSSTGFSVGVDSNTNGTAGNLYASWTFRKQPKFFDVVTYTGNGSNRAISHNLGSTPGCIIVKSTSASGFWAVYHRSEGATKVLLLNTTGASVAVSSYWNDTAPTSTQFTVGTASAVNDNGVTYVAYLFAHDAGGFGLTGTDNVISCGSYTGNGSTTGPTITLGYEPQWLLVKRASGTSNWFLMDVMRELTTDNNSYLYANASDPEYSNLGRFAITSTGFKVITSNSSENATGETYIYIAIRRGPMKTPTTGTSVFQPTTWTGTGAALQQNVNINYDSFMQWRRNGGYSTPWMDRLRGFGYSLYTQQTSAEVNQTAFIAGTLRNNFVNFVDGTYNLNGEPWLNYAFVRAPGFFDVVCYTGTGANRTVSHNLGVVPELMIVKSRSIAQNWPVYSAATGAGNRLRVDSNGASAADTTLWNNTAPTASVFSLGTNTESNSNTATYVAYLFASCPGVSKVGTYTGTGALQTINCGFTGGARFVLIKRTDGIGGWFVYDSARGLSSGNDPYLLLNTTDAEVTSTNYVDTTSVGFQVTAAAPAALNANGGTFVFLAIS